MDFPGAYAKESEYAIPRLRIIHGGTHRMCDQAVDGCGEPYTLQIAAGVYMACEGRIPCRK